MRKSRYSEEQMISILRETDQASVVEVARKHGLSDQTIYLWRKRFGEAKEAEERRLDLHGEAQTSKI